MKKILFSIIILLCACNSDDHEISIVDNIAPIITIIGGNNINVLQNTIYIDAGATSTDNIDGDLTSSIITTGIVNTNSINTYIITYSVTDGANNTTTASRQINVIEDINNPVYLDPNEITIKAKEWSEVGDTGNINGVLYTVVDLLTLKNMIENGDDVTKLATTKVTNMNLLFYNENSFNQNIENWDVSNVTTMYAMFWNAASFNNSIKYWDVSNVAVFRNMFSNATNFNQNIEDWDVSNVISTRGMFSNASAYNQPMANWNVSNVDNMNYMFLNATSFNQEINNWNVSNVTEMYSMFNNANSFNQDLSNWDVTNVITCENFNENTPLWVLPIPNFVNCTLLN